MVDKCHRCKSVGPSLSLKYRCPRCHFEFIINDSDIDPYVGVHIMCSNCGKIVMVPPDAVCDECGHFSKNVVEIINDYNWGIN